MKALISKFENIIYDGKKGRSIVDLTDVDKIKEFQKQGNLFGVFFEKHATKTMDELENMGIKADFMIKEDGSIYFKEGYQYFDYEPFEKFDIMSILTSLNQDYQVKVKTPQTEKIVLDETDLSIDELYTCLCFFDIQDRDRLIEKLCIQFGHLIYIIEQEEEVHVLSKKGSLDKSIDILCGLKDLNIQDVSFISQDCHHEVMIDLVDQLYSFEENDTVKKDILLVDSIAECVDDLLEDRHIFLFYRSIFILKVEYI